MENYGASTSTFSHDSKIFFNLSPVSRRDWTETVTLGLGLPGQWWLAQCSTFQSRRPIDVQPGVAKLPQSTLSKSWGQEAKSRFSPFHSTTVPHLLLPSHNHYNLICCLYRILFIFFPVMEINIRITFF